jgi:hypothetical protein
MTQYFILIDGASRFSPQRRPLGEERSVLIAVSDRWRHRTRVARPAVMVTKQRKARSLLPFLAMTISRVKNVVSLADAAEREQARRS